MPPRRPMRGARAFGLAIVLLAVLSALYGARAAIHWTSDATFHVEVTAPPVHFEAGAGASNTRYIAHFALSDNATAFSGVLKGKAGADATLRDVVRVVNPGASARTVTFTADQVSNSKVQVFAWTVRDGASTVATFDYRVPAPRATFTLPAGASYQMDIRLDLDDGAGKNNAAVPFGLRLEVT